MIKKITITWTFWILLTLANHNQNDGKQKMNDTLVTMVTMVWNFNFCNENFYVGQLTQAPMAFHSICHSGGHSLPSLLAGQWVVFWRITTEHEFRFFKYDPVHFYVSRHFDMLVYSAMLKPYEVMSFDNLYLNSSKSFRDLLTKDWFLTGLYFKKNVNFKRNRWIRFIFQFVCLHLNDTRFPQTACLKSLVS